MPGSEPQAVQKIVSDTLSRTMFDAIWTGNYYKAFPVAMQDFDLSTMLPVIFYLFRYGERRGTGEFFKAFASADARTARQKEGTTTIDRIGEIFRHKDEFEGFEGETEKAILGDLLLNSCLGNKSHEPGRDKKNPENLPDALSIELDRPSRPTGPFAQHTGNDGFHLGR